MIITVRSSETLKLVRAANSGFKSRHDPKGIRRLEVGIGSLRFGAIVNYEEVQPFFIKVPTDGLHHLRALGQSSAHGHVIEMEFDRTGDRILIIAGNVSELAREST